ncbi:hypothetical protein HO173_001969 [Letharia columbiana]|uniref:Sec20 C-terminal domain-containing protein n=1 Tax=Letharia columbiana TaxID=112416 RepID=A0A8H6L9C7_9LECA|nr:uncharacterized protein HO173_001969 [Letharia columbiana]KAF6240358.1 hypothetical protein HO173_001969 [Letharia columbiana]
MTTQALNARLTPLFESLKQTQQLITRLSKFPAQLGASPSNPDEDDARVELSAEIHQTLKEQEEDFELLRQEVEDQTNISSWSSSARRRDAGKGSQRTDLAAQITRLGEDLKIARAQFRKAQLQAKRNAEAAKRKERELLFAGIQEGNSTTAYGRRKGQEKLSQEEILLNASSDVTAALRRTHTLMSAELERSQFARETLETSTKDLATLSESYSNLDTLLSSSRSLVSSLIHSQKSDTWYLESAFYILAATIAWLVFRRLIYGPGWWLLYLPTKWLWRLSLLAVQLLVGSLSAVAGTVGAKNQSSALSQASESIVTSFAQKPTGTGKIPTFRPNSPAPSVNVGAGGQGAKMQQPQQPSRKEDKTLSDQVGEMAEQSQKEEHTQLENTATAEGEQQGTVLRERREDEPPNPKKRMWEEPIDRSRENAPRDEL